MVLGNGIVTAGPLRNLSIMHSMPQFVAPEVFPILQSKDPTMKITKYLSGDFFRDEAGIRAEKGQAPITEYRTTEETYSCDEYAIATEISDELRRNARKMSAQPLQPDVEAMMFLKQKLYTKREKDLVTLIQASTWADGVSGGEDVAGLWAYTNTSTNTFITDLNTAKETLTAKGILGSGQYELRLLMCDLTFNSVRRIETGVRDQIKYTSPDSITSAMLAKLLEVDRIIVPTCVENTDEETVAGTSFTAKRIWNSNTTKGMAMLYVYPKRLGLMTMAPGFIVNDQFSTEEGGGYLRIMKSRDNDHHLDKYELAELRDQLQVAADAAYLWKDTLST